MSKCDGPESRLDLFFPLSSLFLRFLSFIAPRFPTFLFIILSSFFVFSLYCTTLPPKTQLMDEFLIVHSPINRYKIYTDISGYIY